MSLVDCTEIRTDKPYIWGDLEWFPFIIKIKNIFGITKEFKVKPIGGFRDGMQYSKPSERMLSKNISRILTGEAELKQ